MIFVEKDVPLDQEDLYFRLERLRSACDSGQNGLARDVLKQVVSTNKTPEEVNTFAESAEDMKKCRKLAPS